MKFLIVAMITFSAMAQNQTVENFSQSKRNLRKLYAKTSLENKTIYCGCKFKGNKIDTNSCGFELKQRMKRGKMQGMYANRIRIEWEHLTPASKFQVFFPECVKTKNGKPLRDKRGNLKTIGRKKCEKVSKKYRLMISDMYNLYPSVGALNAHRGNLSFAEIAGEKREWGKCDFEISNRKVEPSNEIKGLIARNYFYMQEAYGVNLISKKNKRLFSAWDRQYPATKEECKRYRLIKQFQGNENPVLKRACNGK